MPQAIKITEENYPLIVTETGLLRSEQEPTNDIVRYIVKNLDGYRWVIIPEESFKRYWKFVDTENESQFSEIERL